MVDFINNVGAESLGGYGKILQEDGLNKDGLVEQSVEMDATYLSSSSQSDFQFYKLEINGQKYTGIPDIFQSQNSAVQALFNTLRAGSVITDDMSLEDQLKIMSYLTDLSAQVSESENTNVATAFNGKENVNVTSFIQPRDSSVMTLVSQLQSQGIVTESMSDSEKLSAINSYVNANFSYEADVVGEGWSTAANTIASGSGDCEDMAILVASLAIACGVDESSVQVCVQGGGANSQGHVVVGLVGENGNVATFDATNGEEANSTLSDFTFAFNSQGVSSGNGSVGNSWVMEDANNVDSLYTAESSVSRVRSTISSAIDTTYGSDDPPTGMLGYANKLDQYTNPGSLFILQQELQTMKDRIATYTAVGKMIGDTLSEAMQAFSSSLRDM